MYKISTNNRAMTTEDSKKDKNKTVGGVCHKQFSLLKSETKFKGLRILKLAKENSKKIFNKKHTFMSVVKCKSPFFWEFYLKIFLY